MNSISRNATFVLLVVALILMLYVAAIGPLVWLDRMGWIDAGPDSWLAWFYWPVSQTAIHCPPFGRILRWYVALWEPERAP